MVETEVLRWRVRVDVQRTREGYAQTPSGGAAECQCAYCLNYLRQREHAFPGRVLELLKMLEIPVDKDLEVVEYGPTERGRRLYGAWFYVVGELVAGEGKITGESADEFEALGEDVALRISAQTAFVPTQWRGLRLLLIEINFPLPWVLDERPG